jgi:hypothetical protein
MSISPHPIFKGVFMYQIWDGDLYLYSVETKYEADEAKESGFKVVKSSIVI